MKYQNLFNTILTVAALSTGCAPSNPRLEAPLEKNTPVETLADGNDDVEVNSELDILFVIDDSNSMGKHQYNLANNISEFVKGFAKSKLVDFHIGITTAYDAEIQSRLEDGRTSRKVKINLVGHLLPLKTPKGLESSIKGQPNFISKSTPDYLKVLEASLKVCETPQCPPDGPVFEEFFSPVMSAFSDDVVNGPNAGFYRPKAHLAVIFITDAEDSTKGVSPSRLFAYLRELKGGNSKLVSAHGVLAASADPGCKRDNANIPPTRIEKLLGYYNNRPISLCSKTFGKDLANIGVDISKRIDRKVIPLKYIPAFNDEIVVTYGVPGGKQQEIKANEETGWTYIPAGKPRGPAIVLGEKLSVEYEEGAKLKIKATPLNLANQNNGRVKKK